MRYMLLINANEKEEAAMSPDQMGQLMAGYGELQQAFEAAKGVYQHSDRLRPTTDATTVRVRNGDASITDGPFAETKEQIGGYYLIDVKDLDEAIAWAKKIPSVNYGSVEIRPVWEPED